MLIGTDPQRTPMHINRWGYIEEEMRGAEARLLGVIEAEQTEDGKSERNDRLIAVAAESHTHSSLKSLGTVDKELIKEIEHFFVSYNEARGKKFKPLGCKGPHVATRLVEKHSKRKKKRG